MIKIQSKNAVRLVFSVVPSFLMLWTILFCAVKPIWAQSKKPQVLIYGDGIDAYTAAVQAATSNLNTVWVSKQKNLREILDFPQGPLLHSYHLDSGIWGELLAAALGGDARNDSLAEVAKRGINPQLYLNVVEKKLLDFPQLTHIRGGEIVSVKKGKTTWEVRLKDKRRITIRSVVDATESGELAQLAALGDLSVKRSLEEAEFGSNSGEFPKLARTGVAVGTQNQKLPFTIPLGSLIPNQSNNLFFTKSLPFVKSIAPASTNNPALLAHVGQAVGATAAYVAFYKTTSDKIEVRQVQGELLQYKVRLMPFQDILITDPNFQAIQAVGLTGLFSPKISLEPASGTEVRQSVRFHFDPDAHISSEEIRSTMNQLYSRSQIWFTDHQSTELTVAEFLDLIKYVAYRGSELENVAERQWVRRWKLNSDFDLQKPITRREAAVLLHEFAKPFDVRVDMEGNILR